MTALLHSNAVTAASDSAAAASANAAMMSMLPVWAHLIEGEAMSLHGTLTEGEAGQQMTCPTAAPASAEGL